MNGRMFKIIVIAVLLHLIALGKGCRLEYKKNVSNKPTIFLTTAIYSSVCAIQHDEMNSSTDQWHDPSSTVRGLNYDSQQMRLLYLSNNFDRDHAKLNLLELKDKRTKVAFDQSTLTSVDGIPLSKSIEIVDMTYDWISKNAYLNLREFIVAVNVQNPSKGTKKILSNVGHILSLAVHPNAGYLFYVDTIVFTEGETKVNSTIYRTHLDGSNSVPLVQSDDFIMSLAIDFYKDRLYWAVPRQSLIEHSKLDGTDVRTISGREVRFNLFNDGSRSIDVDQDFVYYLPANTTSVRRFRKGDKQEDADFELRNNKVTEGWKSPITEISVFDSKKQTVRENHPCAVGNGGCEKFCFAKPKNVDLVRACQCADGEKIGVDGASCE